MAGKRRNPDLVVSLAGGCSCPLSELATAIAGVLEAHGLGQVVIHPPAEDDLVWREGWDGFVSDEVVLIRRERGE